MARGLTVTRNYLKNHHEGIFRLNLRLQYSLDFTKMKVYLLKNSLKFQKAVSGFNIYNLRLLPSCLKGLERRMTMPIYKKSSKYFDSQNQSVNLTVTVLTIRVRKKGTKKVLHLSFPPETIMG